MVRFLIRKKNRNEYALCILTSDPRVWPSLGDKGEEERN